VPAGTTWLQHRGASEPGRSKTNDAIRMGNVLVATSATNHPLHVSEAQARLGTMQVVHLSQ